MRESQGDHGGLSTPQNLISPLPSPAPPILSTEINTATRGVHAQLNKFITSRIPLALPPHSEGPALYAHGINAFAQIYFKFEARWHNLIAQQEAGDLGHSAHHAEVQRFLAELIPNGLWRTEAIRSDLEHLHDVLDLRFDATAGTRKLNRELGAHILEVTTAKPHTLIAYAWIMYMAIFSGGRWIRQQLAQAGPSFWHVPEADKTSFGSPGHPVPGFSLFYFEGEQDGEDIKADFKARLEAAEELLSSRERDDIVEEAHRIFNYCIALVEKLDQDLATASRSAALDSDAAYAKAKMAHGQAPVPVTNKNRVQTPLTALLAVLMACLTAWLWMGTR